MTRVYGMKYNQVSSTKEVAAAMRADIKEAVKAGQLPAVKYSVRMDRGRHITVKVSGCPFPVLNIVRVYEDAVDPYKYQREPVHTAKGKALLDQLSAMLEAYNHDGSDIQTDYFDVRFYSNVTFDWQELNAIQEKLLASMRAA